tara:strand:+ start:244 stop:1077 length:834 start_codon:yes stop_codon:yes gene_type:complete
MNSDFFINNPFSRFLEVRGEDRAEFLQGLITNDINKCKKNNAIYSCMLSPQGKFLSDFFIIEQTNNYLIEIHEKYFSSFLSKLEMYKLRSRVRFIENTNVSSFILFANINQFTENFIICFKDPRNNNIGNKVFINKKDKKKIKNLKTSSFENYKEILMKNLVPFCPNDLQENKSLLMENNFHNLQSIDWDKGCYVGQEITARMNYRALLKKQIYSLKIISGEINIGDEIIYDEIVIGKVLSKINNYILCMLKIEFADEKSKNKEEIKINNSRILKYL